MEVKCDLGDLVTILDKKNILSKGDTIHWSYKLYTITETTKDTTPTCLISNFPERYNEALLKKSELTIEKNEKVMEKLNELQTVAFGNN